MLSICYRVLSAADDLYDDRGEIRRIDRSGKIALSCGTIRKLIRAVLI